MEKARFATVLVALATAIAGCGEDSGGSADPRFDEPVYAMMTQVYSLDDRTVYVSLTNGLDFSQLSIESAREFGGVANLAAVGGRLLISEGEAPIIREFDITDDLFWEEGRSVSFANYPLDDNANFYYHFMLDDHTAYLPFAKSGRIVWDPANMTITGVMEDSNLVLERDGLTLDAGGNRNSVRFERNVMQAFFYHDADWFEYGPSSAIAVYDADTHEELKVIDVPCPGLSIATIDENNNVYYSAWGNNLTLALYGDGPAPCVARVKRNLTLDEGFTTDFRDQTDGRFTNNFRYVGDGRAIANVLHHELIPGANWDGEFDPAIDDIINSSGPHWKLWIFDLDNETAHPVEGITVDTASGAQFAVLEGRTFVFLPYDDWGRTKVYEIDDDGMATERYDTIGDIFKWIRVR